MNERLKIGGCPAIRTEPLEPRRLMAVWGNVPRLLGVDKLNDNLSAIDGTGTAIAIIDTGIDYTHPALGNGFGPGKKVVAGWDFADNDADPMDTDGHGTSVAGTIGASAFDTASGRYRGVAPGAKLIALRIDDGTDDVPFNRMEQALQWVLANAATYNIVAVNVSFGYGRFTSDFTDFQVNDELRTLADRNIAVVASSGNKGTADGFGITYPAAHPDVISAGGVDDIDVINEFTQRSSNLDILAPASNVVTTGLSGGYLQVGGTSFAAPEVAAAIALGRQVNPDLTLGEIHSLLRAGSDPNYDGDAEFGSVTNLTFPRLDAYQFVKLAQQRLPNEGTNPSTVGKFGNLNDLAIDDDGVLHLAYFDSADRTMKYATRDTQNRWSTPIVVDSSNIDQGQYVSMALDQFGRPNIAYFDGLNGDLKYAIYDDVKFSTETIDAPGSTGLYPSIAFDADKHPIISYYRKQSGDLKLATKVNNAWSIETIDSVGDVGRSTSLRFDKFGQLGIAYDNTSGGALKLAVRKLDNAWITTTIDSTTLTGVAFTSLRFDSRGTPHISYYDSSPADLKYATISNNVWQLSRVASKGPQGLYSQLILDDQDRPTVLYYDRRHDALQRADLRSGLWQISSLDTAAGRYIAATASKLPGSFLYAYADGSSAQVRVNVLTT